MTTKVLIVNLGPGPLKVITHSADDYSKSNEQEVPASGYVSELYVYENQRVTIIENYPKAVK